MAFLDPVVKDRICKRIRELQEATMTTLDLVLTAEEMMSVITTPAEREIIGRILEVADHDCFAKRGGAELKLVTLCGGQQQVLRLALNAGYWNSIIVMPSESRANMVFNSDSADPEVRSRICDHAVAMLEAARPWASMVHSLRVLDRFASEYAHFHFYLPWLSRVLEEAPCSFVGRFEQKGYDALIKAKPIKSYLMFTREERDFFRQGDGALGSYFLVKDMPIERPSVYAVVKLASSPCITSPFDHEAGRISNILTPLVEI